VGTASGQWLTSQVVKFTTCIHYTYPLVDSTVRRTTMADGVVLGGRWWRSQSAVYGQRNQTQRRGCFYFGMRMINTH